MAGYIGPQPVPQSLRSTQQFLATDGQTSFATTGYTVGYVDVFLNGVLLSPDDYTATNGSDVVLNSGATTDDVLTTVAYSPFDTGVVTTSPTDTTAGRLLKVGDFGLGASVLIEGATNLKDRNLAPGFYHYTTSNVPGGPESLSYFHSLLVLENPLGGRRSFISTRLSDTQPRRWAGRELIDGTIEWQLIYEHGSILGTVSQSGGVPTGGLIESGKNANGVYHKFASGLLICTVSTISSSSGGMIDWVFPHSFTYPGSPDRLVVHGGAGTTGSNAWRLILGGIANPGDRIQFGAVNKSDAFVVANCSMTAVGRWFD